MRWRYLAQGSVIKVAQPWQEVVQGVRIGLPGANSWDILNRAELKISRSLGGLDTGVPTIPIVDPGDAQIAWAFRPLFGALRGLVPLLSAVVGLVSEIFGALPLPWLFPFRFPLGFPAATTSSESPPSCSSSAGCDISPIFIG